MELLLQTDPRLLAIIQKIGCFFMVILTAIQKAANRPFTPAEVNALWEHAIAQKWIAYDARGNLNLGYPVELGNYAFSLLGKPWTIVNGQSENYSTGEKWHPGWYPEFDFIVYFGLTVGGTHYTYHDSKDVETYNPCPGVRILKDGGRSWYKILRGAA